MATITPPHPPHTHEKEQFFKIHNEFTTTTQQHFTKPKESLTIHKKIIQYVIFYVVQNRYNESML